MGSSGFRRRSQEELPDGSYQAVIQDPRHCPGLARDGLEQRPGRRSHLVGAGHRVVHGGERFTASILVDNEVIAAIALVQSSGAAAQPGEPGRHRGGPRRPARLAAGRRVRHRVPPDDAAARFPLRGARGVVHAARGAAVRVPRHQPPLRQRAGRRPAGPAARRARGWSPPTSATGAAWRRCGTACRWTPSMGLTPLEGLVMGTRSGDVDPGLLRLHGRPDRHDRRRAHRGAEHRSGLQALSGVGNDMRTVEAAAADGNERAQLALEVFVHRLAKAIAGLVVEPGPARRAGVHRRHRREQRRRPRPGAEPAWASSAWPRTPRPMPQHGRHTGGASASDGPVLALVVPTNEELLIARDTARVITGG